MDSLCRQWCRLMGRLLLSLIFLMSGIQKVFNWEQTSQSMASQGMILVPLLLIAAIVIEVLGGLSVLLGFGERIGALGLFLFMIPTTLIFHDFWNFEGQEQRMEMIQFLKNLAIMGGLLLVAANGARATRLDEKKSS